MISAIARSILLILLLGIASTIATRLQSRSTYAVKDSHLIPRRWTRLGPAPLLHIVQLQIGLRQSNFGGLEKHLYDGM
jgi:tripeptidyl-peptidase-1